MMRSKQSVRSIMIFLLGFGICLWPVVSRIYQHHLQLQAIQTYNDTLQETRKSDLEDMLKQAQQYNEALALQQMYKVSKKQRKMWYEHCLTMHHSSIMGSIVIPKIGVLLPIYHGVSDAVLSIGAGHLPDSSLPIGGKTSHCVLTSHRGLPNAKLFTRLDELANKDMVYIKGWNHIYAYQVEKIYVIKPEDTERLKIQRNKDLLSLVTCTPYGLNTHRLVIQAKRVPYVKENEKNIVKKSLPFKEWMFLGIPWLFLLCHILLYIKQKRKG